MKTTCLAQKKIRSRQRFRNHRPNESGAKRSRVFMSNRDIDELLWSAYRRYDRREGTKELLHRYLKPMRRRRVCRRELSHG